MESGPKTKVCSGKERLALVNSFRYLGATLQPSGVAYTHHVKEKASLAIVDMNDIKESRISLETSMKLFKRKITKAISYGLGMMWYHLTGKNMETIEKLKATFLKKVICLSKYTPSRLVYILARESFFSKYLRYQLQLPS
jgi:hypothetical protein